MGVSDSGPCFKPPYPGDSDVRTIASGNRIFHKILNKETTLSELGFPITVFALVKNELKTVTQVTLCGGC